MMNRLRKSTKITETSNCPKCEKEFNCSPSGKCWCYEVFIPPDKLNEIGEKYNSCLCPDCLKEFSK